MSTYILLLKVTREGARALKDSQSRSEYVQGIIQSLGGQAFGGRVVSAYALFGAYDFLVIVEGLNDEDMMRMTLHAATRSTAVSETMLAIPLDRFYEIVDDLQL